MHLSKSVGTDIRKCLLDGYPSDSSSPNLIGFDLRKDFIDCGRDLFRDGPTSERPVPITFYNGDIFDKNSALNKVTGKVNYIFISAVFHLFDKETQMNLAERLLDILDISNEASSQRVNREYIIFGMHDGREEEQVIVDVFGSTRYGHSPTSWKRMWEELIGKRYGAEKVRLHVKVEARLGDRIPVMGFVYEEMIWSIRINRSGVRGVACGRRVNFCSFKFVQVGYQTDIFGT